MRFTLVLALSLCILSAAEPQTDTAIFQESLATDYPSIPATNPTRITVTAIAARMATKPDADQEFWILHLLHQAMTVTDTTVALPVTTDAALLGLTDTVRSAGDRMVDFACRLAQSTLAQDEAQVGDLNVLFRTASQTWERWQPILEITAGMPDLLEIIAQRVKNVPVADRPTYQRRLQAAQTKLTESITALPRQTDAKVPSSIVAEWRQIGAVRLAALEIDLIADDLDVVYQLTDRPADAGPAADLAAKITRAIAARNDAKRAVLAHSIELRILEYRSEGLFDRQARHEDEYYQLLDAWVNGEAEAFDPVVEPTPADRELDEASVPK